VIALPGFKDWKLREQLEIHLVKYLKEIHVEAISGIQIYGPKKFENRQEDSIVKMIEADGLDGILTIALLNKEREKNYMPGRVYYTPYFIYHNHFGRYYNTILERIEEPGYYTETTNYFFETNLYDTESNKLWYSSQSKSFNPSSIYSLAEDYSKSIKNDLVKSGVIK
jgi:hypothetical protein